MINKALPLKYEASRNEKIFMFCDNLFANMAVLICTVLVWCIFSANFYCIHVWIIPPIQVYTKRTDIKIKYYIFVYLICEIQNLYNGSDNLNGSPRHRLSPMTLTSCEKKLSDSYDIRSLKLHPSVNSFIKLLSWTILDNWSILVSILL